MRELTWHVFNIILGWLNVVLGWLLISVGVLGTIVPIIPGLPLIAVGFLLLAREQAWARRLLNSFCTRFPRLGRHVMAVEDWIGRTETRIGNWFCRRRTPRYSRRVT
jgi:hypothetical protein